MTSQLLVDQPWALQEGAMRALMEFERTFDGTAAALPAAVKNAPAPTRRKGGIGVIPIRGVLKQHPADSFLDLLFGGASTETIAAQINAFVADPDVAVVLLDIDSPGGSTFGMTELHRVIMSARLRKPIVAIANSVAASGGYWLASAADKVFCTPGGSVGSVGVFLVHQDLSGAAAKAGISVTMIGTPEHKLRGNQWSPLSKDDEAHYRGVIESTYATMIDDIARGRRYAPSAVRSGFGLGDMLTAQKALAAGMVDAIMPLPEAIAAALSVRAGAS